jgi:hypothetical protein
VRDALRQLATDSWVLGIAAAIAIGYAVVSFLRDVARTAIATAEGELTGGLFVVTVLGRKVSFELVATSTATLLLTVGVFAAALLYARGREVAGE